MSSNSGDSGDPRPDLNKHPDESGATQAHPAPVNPYPAHPTYSTPSSDQFAPYTPPDYGDPLGTEYSSSPYQQPQYQQPHYSTPEHPIPQYPAPHPEAGYPAPQYLGPPYPARLQPAAVAATRALAAIAMMGALLFIAYGWWTWASFTPKYTDAAAVSVNGWGQVFQDGSQITMDPGTAGTPFAAIFIPFFVLPVAILALLVMCNIGRVGNSIAILVLAALHLFLALTILLVPSTCIIFDNDDDSVLFEGLNDFSTGPGAVLATATLVVVIGTSIAGIVLGRKKIYPTTTDIPGHGGYPGY